MTRNVVASIGPTSGKRLLLNAHYDSTPTGPGASDDGLGVASLIEVAANLRAKPPSRPVTFLFNEGEEFGLKLALRGASERLSPILMTALATGLALVPLVITGDIPGHEIEYPMAIVILGGLITSTLLNLFVVPSLYLTFAKDSTSHAGSIQPVSEWTPAVSSD